MAKRKQSLRQRATEKHKQALDAKALRLTQDRMQAEVGQRLIWLGRRLQTTRLTDTQIDIAIMSLGHQQSCLLCLQTDRNVLKSVTDPQPNVDLGVEPHVTYVPIGPSAKGVGELIKDGLPVERLGKLVAEDNGPRPQFERLKRAADRGTLFKAIREEDKGVG